MMKYIFESYYKGIKKYIRVLNDFSKDKHLNSTYTILDCIWSFIRYGCVLNQFIDGCFYKRKYFERKDILTYKRRCGIMKHYNNSDDVKILQNKVEFNKYFKDFIKRDWISIKEANYETFNNFMRGKQEVIIKPLDNWEGIGVRVLKIENHNKVKQLYGEYQDKDLLFEQKIVQKEEMIFNNKSVNTIRIYTACGKNSKKAHIFKATLRIGIGESIVDNSHNGGCAYEVDLKTGIVCSKGWGHIYNDNIIHPGSEKKVIGFSIPFWKDVVSMCCSAAERIPTVPFIGWDVAVSSHDEPLLIEGNHDPDLDMIEFVGSYGYYKKIIEMLEN